MGFPAEKKDIDGDWIVVPDALLPDSERTKIDKTIKDLGLNNPTVKIRRKQCVCDFLKPDNPCDHAHMKERQPFVYRELRRSGRLSSGSPVEGMATSSNLPAWVPRYAYSDVLVADLCAIATARTNVELLPLPPDDCLRLHHEAYQRSTRSSTRIEGNPLDDAAVQRAVATTDRTGSKAEQEVRNYWRGLDLVDDWAQGSQPLSEAWIQQLHAVVIVRGRGCRRQRTPYRSGEIPVVDTLTGCIDYAPPHPGDVPALMGQLCRWWQQSEHLPAVVRAALLSHRFISVHPFDDGNGRCGRLLATAALWRCGYFFRGFLSFEEWFSQDREAYYQALQLGYPADFYDGRHDPDHSPWLAYCARVIRQAAADLASKAQALHSRQTPADPHPWEALDRRSQQLLTRLGARVADGQSHPVSFKPADLQVWFAVSTSTAQEWLRNWKQQGLLVPTKEDSQRVRTWPLAEPWASWVLGQLDGRE